MNWPPNEVSTLVHYLHKHGERIGDGSNFRQDIYAAAAAHLNMIHPNPTHPKTADAVKNKWMSFKGANIVGADAEEVFNGYAKEQHPLIRHFKNSGWELYTFLQDILENDSHAQGESAYAPTNVNTAMGSVDCTGGTGGAGEANQIDEEMPSMSVSTAAPSLPSVPPLPLDGASSKGKECKVEPPPDMSLPSPPSSSKHSYTEMASNSTEDYATSNISGPPFSNSSMSHTSSSANITSIPSRQCSVVKRAQDNDLPREVKLFVRSMITCDPGFTEVYALTVDKDEWQDYVMLEYKVKTRNVASLNTAL
ncbi:hypothetical protein SCLCIDRAFT_9936 [Scleroderma citrinum Foug A]|uniref:Myb/SANT-like domain-containing protein n=1 Tax=Scleroderma citrinum Foug A TaxID=1036808 RepID=A0A0C3A438_9AGAM|nr:hypothetical protein SCLCIDRAFT_9936 [Scleroderma citrinum Foug A]